MTELKHSIKPVSESKHQVTLFQWSKLNERKYPELRWLHSVNNAPKLGKTADIKTRQIRGAQMNREGRKKGVFDICLPVKRVPYSGLYIEMKVGKNKLTEEQEEFKTFVEEQDFKTAICYDWKTASEILEEYLA